jgi:hypothetical protein
MMTRKQLLFRIKADKEFVLWFRKIAGPSAKWATLRARETQR